MANIWFTSDTHFGNSNVFGLEKDARVFLCTEEMHEVLIDCWNNVVGHKDIVYHLGGFARDRNGLEVAGRLKGKKRLVLGNHDNFPIVDYLQYFDKCFGVTIYGPCILSHVPVHPHTLCHEWCLNVHGHLHGKSIMENEMVAPDSQYPIGWCIVPDKNYLNVSCGQNNLTPVHQDIIRQRLKEISQGARPWPSAKS